MHDFYLRGWQCDRIRAVFIIGSLALSNIGCGSINNAHPDAASGGSVDASIDAAVPDAGMTARCDPTKPFGTPTLVPNINSPARDQGAILVDDLTLYLGSDRPPSTGLYKATRSSPTSPFSTPVPLTAINATGAATGPSVTGDGLTLYYALIAPGQTTGDLYVTSRPNRTAEFPAGTPVAGLNSTVDDLDAFITADDSTLYFDSARPGGAGVLDLYFAVRQQASGLFDAPQALTNLNTSVTDGHPVLTRDGLTLYWSSARSDGGALGGTDIWTATRTSTAGSFGTPVQVPELSSSASESLSWIAPDGCSAFLQSDRQATGALGAQDIFEAVKPM